MFIAMNRFRVKKDQAAVFEKVWRERESFLSQVAGFVRFHLLRSVLPPATESVEFVSHSQWLDLKSFEGWLSGEASRKAHAQGGGVREMLAGPPEFKGYEIVLDEVAGHRTDFRSVHQDRIVVEHFGQESGAQKKLEAHGREKGLPPINIGPLEGRLLEILLRSVGARRGIEFGTLGGYSASWLARALPEDGELITLELEAERAADAQRWLDEAGFGKQVKVLAGPALETLKKLENLKDLDFAFIDADKAGYPRYVEWVIPRLRKGGILLVDNAYLWGAMNYYGKSPAELPVPDNEGLHGYSRTQFSAMSECWRQMHTHPDLASLILPTGEGLGIALKL